MTNDGIARAAQALAPRVTKSFLKLIIRQKGSRRAEYIIRRSICRRQTSACSPLANWTFISFSFDQTGRFLARGGALMKQVESESR